MRRSGTFRRSAGLGAATGLALALPGCPLLLEDGFDLHDRSTTSVAPGDSSLNGPSDASVQDPPGPDGDPRDAGAEDASPPKPKPGPPEPGRCDNGVIDGSETGIDCGPPGCDKCVCTSVFDAPEVLITGLGPNGSFFSPSPTLDNRSMFFSRLLDGTEALYLTAREDRGRIFSDPFALGISSSGVDGAPFITPDGLALYFASARAGGSGGRDLWLATRSSATSRFDAPAPIAAVNGADLEDFPMLSPNGLELWLVSDRAGGQGGTDLWRAERTALDQPFGAPSNVTELNTSSNEGAATLSRDGLRVIFASERPGGMGGSDLWLATRPSLTVAFGSPVNLTAVNDASFDGDPRLSTDGRELFFASERSGARHLWRALRECP